MSRYDDRRDERRDRYDDRHDDRYDDRRRDGDYRQRDYHERDRRGDYERERERGGGSDYHRRDERDRRDDHNRERENRDRERERERARERERERGRDRHFDPQRHANSSSSAHSIHASGGSSNVGAASRMPDDSSASYREQRERREREASEADLAAKAALAAKKAAEEEEYQRKVAEQMAEVEESEEDAEARAMEERRKRRAEILARHKGGAGGAGGASGGAAAAGNGGGGSGSAVGGSRNETKVEPNASEGGTSAASLAEASACGPGGSGGSCVTSPVAPGSAASPSARVALSAAGGGLGNPSAEPMDVSSTMPSSSAAAFGNPTSSEHTHSLHASVAASASSAAGHSAAGANGQGAAHTHTANSGSDDDDDLGVGGAPVPLAKVTSAEMTDEQRRKEAELKAYLLNQRRQSEGGVGKPSQTPQQQQQQPPTGADDESAPREETADTSVAASDGKATEANDPGGGFDMFSDEVEEVPADLEDAVDEAAMMDRGDNYDDKEGYYAHRVGDLLNDRYKILGSYGKGVFSTVVRCLDTKSATSGYEVAIKVQRNNEMMRRAGEKEISYLTQLAANDPDNRRHCIQFLGSFDHEDHLCMIFEAMHQNLRVALRQHGHRRGIQIDAVKTYARQMFIALRYLERLNIMHADLKPDNIVVNDKYNLLKICDFGSASSGDDNEITPYLVSRFYRAPEIMMGLQYGCPIDTWAAAVSLFELFTGKIMFQGNSNNMMLKLIQEVKGKMPHKLIRKGTFSELHFDPDYDFLYKERDRVSGREIVRIIKYEQRPLPGKELKTTLMPVKLPEAEARKVQQMADFLEKALMLDPSKRLTPSQALKHPLCDTRPAR